MKIEFKPLLTHVLLAAWVWGLGATALHADEDVPPNVVVIISDDQGYADYGFMGHEVIQTPNLDELASQSLVFKRGYVTTALCCPSLATMLTGMYPHQHGYTGNDPVKGANRTDWINLFAAQPQLPALLGESGYLSLHTGKYWQGNPRVSGFTDSMGDTLRHGSPDSLGIGRETMQPVYDFIAKSQAQSKPFLVWYAPFMPHTPHTPPDRLEKKYAALEAGAQSKYYAMCEWFDETCGDLLEHLDEKGLSENTIVFYICDNGWGSLGRGSVKSSPYELGVRTPIMIRWPGQVEPRTDEDNLASNLDLVPTILDACGLSPTPQMSGINLLDHQAVSKRKHLFLENFTHDMLDVDRPSDSLRSRSCVQNDWKLTVWSDLHPALDIKGWQIPSPDEKVQLFDLKNDPMERHNVATQHPEKVSELMKLVNRWWNPSEVAQLQTTGESP